MTLMRRGYVKFTDPDAAECYAMFRHWAAEVSAAPFNDVDSRWHEVAKFYYELHSRQWQDEPASVIEYGPLDSNPIVVWVDASRYEVSMALLDGFFSGTKNFIGEVLTKARDLRHSWVDIADRMIDESGEFSPARATVETDVLAIDVQMTGHGSVVTSRTSDGRHRLTAMRALGAPVMPVRLRL